MNTPLTLISGLGTDKNLILELIDFFNKQELQYNEEGSEVRKKFSGRPLSSVYLICTESVEETFQDLRQSLDREYPEITLEAVQLFCEDISCVSEDEKMRERVYETVRNLAGNDLVVSSGGRKQVTQRLIEAGLLFGCMGYLSITAPYMSEGKGDIRGRTLELNVSWIPVRQFSEERRKQLVKDELGDNFRSLYLLPVNMIQRLRNEKIGDDGQGRKQELEWLRKMPKADLHCHLGGAFDVSLLQEMARRLLLDCKLSLEEQKEIISRLEERLQKKLGEINPDDLLHLTDGGNEHPVHPLKNLEKLFNTSPEPKHQLTAVLINSLNTQQIEDITWSEPDNLVAGDCLKWYMACGDLGGSSLLQTKGTLRLALKWLMEKALKENVLYLEVRFSPDNYTRGGLSIQEVVETLLDAADNFSAQHKDFSVNFLIMATRHKNKAAMEAHVAAAILYGSPSEGKGVRITGFDLAGQEEGYDPELFRDTLMPLHHHFMNITIHAGEMEDDEKIWQAIYLLHARRIGHGLKLINNKKMMGYVRDYSIGIEMCPSSNMQTNDYTYAGNGQDNTPAYPLKNYLDFGLQVSINTDNRGISKTTLSGEYLEAARLTPGGLSKWEILKLAKNSFKTAFLPKDEKDRLLKEMDAKVFQLVLDDFFKGEEAND